MHALKYEQHKTDSVQKEPSSRAFRQNCVNKRTRWRKDIKRHTGSDAEMKNEVLQANRIQSWGENTVSIRILASAL